MVGVRPDDEYRPGRKQLVDLRFLVRDPQRPQPPVISVDDHDMIVALTDVVPPHACFDTQLIADCLPKIEE